MYKTNKKSFANSACAVAVLLIAVILYESAGSEFLHNHKPDLYEHRNCPVASLHAAVSTGIVVHTDIPNERIVVHLVVETQALSLLHSHFSTANLRAPPLTVIFSLH